MKIDKKFMIEIIFKIIIVGIIEFFIFYLCSNFIIDRKIKNGLIEYYYYVEDNYVELEKRIMRLENTLQREDEVMGLLTYSYLKYRMEKENKTIEEIAEDEKKMLKKKYGIIQRFYDARSIKYDKMRIESILK